MGNLSVGKGATFIYIELIVAALSGYILWLLLSKITTPEVIGTSSTVVAIATIFAVCRIIWYPQWDTTILGENVF